MFISFSTFILFILLLLTLFYYLQFRWRLQINRKRLPGPDPEWLVGNLRNRGLLSGKKTIHEVYSELKKEFGNRFSFWLGPAHMVVLSNIEDAEKVLSNRHLFDISTRTTSTFGILFPYGLIALRGNDWKRHARFMLPTFKRAKILPYLQTIVDCADQFIDGKLAPKSGQIHEDLLVQCQNVLVNIIALIAFDYDLESSSDNQNDGQLRKAFNDFVHCANEFIFYSPFPLWFGKIMLLLNRKYQRALKVMQHYIMAIIDEEQNRKNSQWNSSNRPRNLISNLVASLDDDSSTKTRLTPKEVFDEVSLSILAGFETTSTALSWFIFYMTKYPEIQEKIKTELRENHLLGRQNLTLETLDSLIYIDCVVREVLRYAPIAGAISREATADCRIDDIPISKGDTITIAVHNIHHDPRYWNIDPTKFYPERFLDEDKNPRPYSFLQFGGGHRACAGQDLAFFELKVLITRLMQRVTFEDPKSEANNSGGYVQRITCYPKHLAVKIHLV